jgi:hypothetical protein
MADGLGQLLLSCRSWSDDASPGDRLDGIAGLRDGNDGLALDATRLDGQIDTDDADHERLVRCQPQFDMLLLRERTCRPHPLKGFRDGG